MKLTLICGFCCFLTLSACSAAENPSQHADDRNTLIALERMWNQAQLTRDAQALENLLGEHFVNTEWDGSVTNRERFLADIRDPKFQPSVMSNEGVNVDFYGTAAVVTGSYHVKGTYHGKPYEHVGRFTDTWILSSGKWQCVASHTSLLKEGGKP